MRVLICNKWLRCMVSHRVGLRALSDNTKEIRSMFDNYDISQQQQILNVLNVATLVQLKNYKIGKNLTMKIIKERQESNFENLHRLQTMEGVSIKKLKMLCDNILGLNGSVLRKTFYSPTLSQTTKNDIKNIVAINVSLTNFSWINVSRDLQVVDWNASNYDCEPKYMTMFEIYEKVKLVTESIPKADVYVLEELPYKASSSNQTKMFQKSLEFMHAMLIASLNSRSENVSQHHVFFLKPSAVTSYFNLNVGGERVSSIDVAEEILKCNQCLENISQSLIRPKSDVPSLCSNVTISNELRTRFLNEKSIIKNEISTLLLVTMVFYDLVNIKVPHCTKC